VREDMAKVIVERPRYGGQKNRKGRRQNFDELPVKEGISRGISDRKDLNENLAPLRRFLASQVGRPWDKVYAEICANLKPTNTVQQHVRAHLADFVARKLRVNEVGVLEHHGWRGPDTQWHQPFYVDPRDGVLKQTVSEKERKRRARRREQELAAAKDAVEKIILGPMTELLRLDGIWYRVEYAPVPPPVPRARAASDGTTRVETYQPEAYDVLRRSHVTSGARYAAEKRQLTTEELRRQGLKNTPA
jgi:hypothetical protein